MREISIAIFYKSSQILIRRNLTDIRKTVETGVDPHLVLWFPKHSNLLLIGQ